VTGDWLVTEGNLFKGKIQKSTQNKNLIQKYTQPINKNTNIYPVSILIQNYT
jgi:hypothetical protein